MANGLFRNFFESDAFHFMGRVERLTTGNLPVLRMTIPAGKRGAYRVSQMDDYFNRARRDFSYNPPVSLHLEARVSAIDLPGTWGFGFWNDPFTAGMGIKGSKWRLPALPQAAWFFYGSDRNDLSFHSESQAAGLMASVFSSTSIPSCLLFPALPGAILLPFKPAARLIRRVSARIIRDEFKILKPNVMDWHSYRLNWLRDSVIFMVDDVEVLTAFQCPKPPLGLVIWIDNQYAAFQSDGSIRVGTEANPEPAWLEIRNLQISRQ